MRLILAASSLARCASETTSGKGQGHRCDIAVTKLAFNAPKTNHCGKAKPAKLQKQMPGGDNAMGVLHEPKALKGKSCQLA
jgi:hypothetical protein